MNNNHNNKILFVFVYERNLNGFNYPISFVFCLQIQV